MGTIELVPRKVEGEERERGERDQAALRMHVSFVQCTYPLLLFSLVIFFFLGPSGGLGKEKEKPHSDDRAPQLIRGVLDGDGVWVMSCEITSLAV